MKKIDEGSKYPNERFQERKQHKYCFIGPSIRPVTSEMEKTAEKTVYISMGTVVKNHEIYQNCLEVLGNTEYQVIISLGDHELEYDSLPENVKVYRSVDQMAVLSIADVFLIHCGMNSASEALYFEVPLVMFPVTAFCAKPLFMSDIRETLMTAIGQKQSGV